MLANIGFVPFPVNYASGYAVGITCMVLPLTKVTFAGVSVFSLFVGYCSSRLFRQEHSCSALCSAPGICQIDTTPQSIEATFTGRHETFQYTKVCPLLRGSRRILI
jgi:hypothetical protein